MSVIHWAGDSTVKFNNITTYPQTGIGQAMELYINNDIEILNYAENGRSTKSFLEEGRLVEIEKKMKEGDFLFIQFGHNDQKDDLLRNTQAFGSYQENLKLFIDAAKVKRAFPLLITPLYRRHFNEGGVLLEGVHQDYPRAMIELARSQGIAYIDLCLKSKQLISKTGAKDSKRWFMNLPPGEYNNYMEGLIDDTHLRYEGAVIMAGLIAQGLVELGGIYKALLL